MSNTPPVPNLPPLSSISDAATRNYLQALTNGWRVRNGELGDGGEKFLTVNDLSDTISGVTTSVAASGSSAVSVSKAAPAWAQTLKRQWQNLQNSVLQSRMWKELEERLTAVETPEWFTQQFGAAIKEEQIIRESESRVLANSVNTSIAKLNNNLAIAKTELSATSTSVSSQASQITTLQTTVSGVSTTANQAASTAGQASSAANQAASTANQAASTANQAASTAGQASATASQASATASQASATASQAFTLAQSTSGTLSASWSVKVDYNGYVSGFGYGVDAKSGSVSSNFYVRADTFAVGAPGAQNAVPFTVSGGKTWINSAYIQDASIGNAKIATGAIDSARIQDGAITSAKIGNLQVQSANIADLTVGTNKITGNAVTVATGGVVSGSNTATFWMYCPSAAYVLEVHAAYNWWDTNPYPTVALDGVIILEIDGRNAPGAVFCVRQNIAAGWHSFTVYGHGPTITLFAAAFMR